MALILKNVPGKKSGADPIQKFSLGKVVWNSLICWKTNFEHQRQASIPKSDRVNPFKLVKL